MFIIRLDTWSQPKTMLVVLKNDIISRDKISDVTALDQVNYLVSTYRYKENMKQVIYPLRSARHNTLVCLIAKNTQLPNFN